MFWLTRGRSKGEGYAYRDTDGRSGRRSGDERKSRQPVVPVKLTRGYAKSGFARKFFVRIQRFFLTRLKNDALIMNPAWNSAANQRGKEQGMRAQAMDDTPVHMIHC